MAAALGIKARSAMVKRSGTSGEGGFFVIRAIISTVLPRPIASNKKPPRVASGSTLVFFARRDRAASSTRISPVTGESSAVSCLDSSSPGASSIHCAGAYV